MVRKFEFTPDPMTEADLGENDILIIASNDKGQHGGGSARFAFDKLGLEWGLGEGISSNGRVYAFPTLHFPETGRKDPLGITKYSHQELIDSFFKLYDVIRNNPSKTFYLTKVGCGIAGFSIEEMKDLFNVVFDEKTMPYNLVIPIEFS